jgi:error-prone DNA polymerase
MALTEIQGISTSEVERIIKNQPYESIADFFERAKVSRRTLERLALVGGLDSLGLLEENGGTRGDVLARIRQLNAIKNRKRIDPGAPMLDFDLVDTMPKGNPEMPAAERVSHEMSILKMDVTEHVLDKYRPMLEAMGVSQANELAQLRNKSNVLVAGVRVATQTPPMRSGKRVVFISLDDGSGCSDSTFFEDAQERCSHILFNSRLLVIAGKTRRTGVRGVSLMAENAWNLDELWQNWLAKDGLVAVENREQSQDLYV